MADRRTLVLDAICEGYRERGPGHVVEQVRAHRKCYELLFVLRTMGNLDDWFRSMELGGEIDDAATELRTEVSTRL